MEEWLNQILDSSQLPILTAFVLGLLTAISPCPLATNITAVAYISRNIESRRKVFVQGLLYTLGRAFAYTTLGAVLIYLLRKGADTFELQQFVSEWGELVIGPMLILIGLFMLMGHLLHLPKFGFSGTSHLPLGGGREGASLLLGILFAMAFCPTSGFFYFGMLIPMSAAETSGYLLPVIFAIATSIPVLVVSWIISFSIQSLSRFMRSISVFQKWFNRMIAIIFIGVGIYYSIMMYL